MTDLRGAWRLAALPALVAAGLMLVAACGDDDDTDPRVGQIGGVSELATYAYTDAGAEGLYDYLSANVTDVCTKEQVTAALVSHEKPTGWQQVKDVKFQGEDAATATVILIFSSERQEEEWTFVREGTSWRIDSVPGLETCGTAG
jgi:hypothetical protein